MYSTLFRALFSPLDRAILSRICRKRRFIERPVSWRWRRLAKRALCGALEARGRADAVTRSGLLFDVARYLDWPDVDRVFREGRWVWNRDQDGRSIAADIDRVFGASNRRTAELTGLPLKDLGYQMEGEEVADLPDHAQGRGLDLSLQPTE
jgi:hypothetical protein